MRVSLLSLVNDLKRDCQRVDSLMSFGAFARGVVICSCNILLHRTWKLCPFVEAVFRLEAGLAWFGFPWPKDSLTVLCMNQICVTSTSCRLLGGSTIPELHICQHKSAHRPSGCHHLIAPSCRSRPNLMSGQRPQHLCSAEARPKTSLHMGQLTCVVHSIHDIPHYRTLLFQDKISQ